MRLRPFARVPAVVLLASLASATSVPADTVETLGTIGSIALPVSGLVAAAAHEDKRGALQLAEAYGVAMAVVYVIKPTIDRPRPDGGRQSFPSGHTASAFAGAAFLQRRYGWSWGVPAYALASFVGYSRVEAKRHYTSDVIAGGAIGIGANLLLTRKYPRVTMLPTPVPGGMGLTLDVRW